MAHGVMEPIVFLKDPETGSIDVVAGRQRVKNSREANRRLIAEGRTPIQVPGYTRRGLDARTGAALMASENAIRQNESPMGRARMMQHLVGQGYTEGDLAVIFGVAAPTVSTSLCLLECTGAVQKAVDAGQINVTHAKALAKLAPEEQRAKVQELIAAGDGAKPHERARRQAKVIGGDKPRVKTKKEIAKALEAASGEYALALRWVLGLEQPATTEEQPAGPAGDAAEHAHAGGGQAEATGQPGAADMPGMVAAKEAVQALDQQIEQQRAA
jgi:ParB family chromosome partitioning protein